MLQLKQRATSGGYTRRPIYNNNSRYSRDLRADAPAFKPSAAAVENSDKKQPNPALSNPIQPNLSAAASIGLLAQQLLDPNAMLLAAQAQLLLAGAGGLPNPSSLPLPPGKGNDSSDLDIKSEIPDIKIKKEADANTNKDEKSVSKRKPSSTSVSSNNDLQKGFEN